MQRLADPASPRPRQRRVLLRSAMIVGATLCAIATAELAVRLSSAPVEPHSLHTTSLDQPYLYGLDDDHPEVSSQGLRDREFVIPKPKDVTRVVLLGDSVVYGAGVGIDDTISRAIERRLADVRPRVEVVNTGVHGWTPFNELGFYRTRGREFGADVVIVVFCLNDVVDPLLHWSYSQAVIPSVPDAAIPNPEYHHSHARGVLEARYRKQVARHEFPLVWLRRSALFRKLSEAFEQKPAAPSALVDGRLWSTQLTGEDSISIEVLMDEESAEWRWLRGIYGELYEAVRADGAEFVVASVPLAYQLDPAYPFVPQDLLARYCAQLGVDYVPALPRLRALGATPADTFLGRESGYDDIWHLTPQGLEHVAAGIAEHLRDVVLPRLPR